MLSLEPPSVQHLRRQFREFASRYVAPFANEYDAEQAIPEALIERLAQAGYLGASLPQAYGGQDWKPDVLAALYEEIGFACSSTRSLLTVHLSLVAETINRWGTEAQKRVWLPDLATGRKIAAFGLSEPATGSDARNIQTTYVQQGSDFMLTGVKRWITFGQRADVLLIFASREQKVSAFLVERNTPGLTVVPITGMMGTRASLLAEVHLADCRVPGQQLLGAQDWGFAQIANTALDNGRFSVAAGTLGIARACLEHSITYAKTRVQFGVLLKEHQLIKQKIANMVTNVKAASLLCDHAASLRCANHPNALVQTSVAKYFTARIASEAAAEAVQIHGAAGFQETCSVQRFFRDAKVMEIIEGSSEIQQLVIADEALASLQTIL